MGIKDADFLMLIKVRNRVESQRDDIPIPLPTQKMQLLDDRIKTHPITSNPNLPEFYELYARKQDVHTQVREMRKKVQAARDLMQLEELRCRKRVLRRLGFASSSDVVEMKGRVACEISTGDELLLTEMIFDGVFNTLSPEQSAALLSCFVFGEKVC